ncbi:MAG TPA: hypothetical protein VFA60_04130 [Terriglobales bacterium]|nr:hypothetical protein [Terriglobales bacterium]
MSLYFFRLRLSEARQRWLARVRAWLRRRRASPPPDPYADVLAPLRRGPRPRSGAAAVAEPDEFEP